MAHEPDDAVALVVGKAKALEEWPGQFRADALMLVEGVILGLVAEGA